MVWLTTRRPTTRELVRAEHRPRAAAAGSAGRWCMLALLCVIGALVYLRGHEHAVHAQRIAELREQSEALNAALERSRLQRQETQATEEQLLKRIATLSAQVERLHTELAFFRQQKKAR